MKISKIIVMLGILTLSLTSSAFAQSGASGGGREKELALRQMMMDLIPYLESDQGQKDFPEIVNYNQSHPFENFSSLIRNTAIVLNEGSVKDGFDVDRDCVSYFGDVSNRRIVCNASAIPAPSVLENQPTLFAFLFHEALVQAQIEKPKSSEIPSDYSVSARMQFHKETFEKMLPGESKVSTQGGSIAGFTDEETKSACVGSFCKMMTLGLDSRGVVSAIRVNQTLYNILASSLRELVNSRPGEDPTYPQFTPAEQDMIELYLGISNLFGKTLGTTLGTNNPVQMPGENHLVSVVTSNDGRNLSLYIERSIYDAFAINLQRLIPQDPEDGALVPVLSAVNNILFKVFESLVEDLGKGNLLSAEITKEQYDVVLAQMSKWTLSDFYIMGDSFPYHDAIYIILSKTLRLQK